MKGNRPHDGTRNWGRDAFTLVELMIAMAVLALVLVLMLTMVNHIAGLWQRTSGKIATFQEARAGFEAITRKLSQATLNTYWDYDPPVSLGGVPQRYVRQSDLHFISGQAQQLIGSLAGAKTPTHAVFFQAPIGYSVAATTGATDQQLENLLNTSGFFIQHGDTADDRPNFLKTMMPSRTRYRLMELWQPTEQFNLFTVTPGNTSWFRDALAAVPSPARPVSENIVALVLWPRRASTNVTTGITLDYSYDSRRYVNLPGDELAELTRNQLPQIIQVTMVALDAASGDRLEEDLPGKEILAPGALFASLGSANDLKAQTAIYEADLNRLVTFLQDNRLNYQVFTTNVTIRQAKWSEN